MWKCTTIDIYPWFYVNLIYRSNWSLGIMSLWQTGSDVLIWITLYHVFSWSMTSSIPSTHYLDIADWFYYAHKWCRIRDRPSYFRREGLCLFFLNCLSPNLIEENKNVTICPEMFRGEVLVRCPEKIIRILNNILVRWKLNGRSLT